MLRISLTESATTAVLGLEGRLIGPWVEELRFAVDDLRSHGMVCVNLEHLIFADAEGLQLLLELRRRGDQIAGGTPLILGLLDREQERGAQAAAEMRPAAD